MSYNHRLKAVQSGMTSISPLAAREMLEHNSNNRILNSTRVAQFAADMLAGRWVPNGESIIIADDGTIIDGQHRLHAIVKSGVTIVTMLVRGVPRDAFRSVDQGRPRSLGDVLGINGEKYRTTVAAALRLIVWAHGNPRYAYGGLRATESTTGAMLERLPEFEDGLREAVGAAVKMHGPPGLIAHGTLAFALYMGMRYAPEHRPEWFWGSMVSGEGLHSGMPQFTLRNWLTTKKGAMYGYDGRMLLMAEVMRAWNAQCESRPLMRAHGQVRHEEGALPGFFGDGWYGKTDRTKARAIIKAKAARKGTKA